MSQTDLTNEGKINEFMNGLLKYINRKALSDMSQFQKPLLTSPASQLKKREAARKERRRKQKKSSAKKKKMSKIYVNKLFLFI